MRTYLLLDSLPKRIPDGLRLVDCGHLARLKLACVHDIQAMDFTRPLLVNCILDSASADLRRFPVGEVTLASC